MTREDELRAELDDLADRYIDVLAPDEYETPFRLAVTLLTAWFDGDEPNEEAAVVRRDSASTNPLMAVGLIAIARERPVEQGAT